MNAKEEVLSSTDLTHQGAYVARLIMTDNDVILVNLCNLLGRFIDDIDDLKRTPLIKT